ncbi:MAG: hypothetical protein AAF492_30655, partial [Verrucomicrobiota bacterium]
GEGSPLHALRYLLARRLTREQRFAEARDYFPTELKKTFDRFVKGLEVARDPRKSERLRARGWWTAAEIARIKGMEIMGAENSPDWKSLGDGSYSFEHWFVDFRKSDRKDKLSATSPDERKRIEGSDIGDGKRFHYRYLAAGYAWNAVELLPDNSEPAAYMLCRAGRWIMNKDPETADRYYKTLVRRFRHTQLGREADQLHWFPDPESVAVVMKDFAL